LRAPDHPAKGRLVRQVERLLFPERGLPCQTADGMMLHLHPRDANAALMLQGRPYQRGLRLFIEANLSPGTVVR
jgi:hypothetical protein